ncbi:hypothetical protein D9M68_570780 [compost metagenome]
MAGRPLGGDIAIEVLAVLVFRGQLVDVGAVFAEALGQAEMGAEQGGIEGPVQGFDIGVAPEAVVVAQALAAQAQLFARVSGEAGIADPELAHRQVAVIGLAVVVIVADVGRTLFQVGGLQGVGFDGVGGGHRLGHGVGAPVAALEVEPGAHVDTDAADIAAVAGAEVAIVLGLGGDLDVEPERLVVRRCGPCRCAAEQGNGQANADPMISVHDLFR